MMRSLSSRQGLLLVSQGLALACLVGGAVRCSSSTGGNVVQPGGDDGGSSSGVGSSSNGGSSGGTSSNGGSSSGTTSSSGGSSSSSSSGSSSGGSSSGLTVEAGADGGCPSQDSSTLATKITFTVGWPSTGVSYASDDATHGVKGEVDILLLTNFTGTTTLTGTSQSCGLVLPPLVLNAIGGAAAGGGDGTKVLIQVTNSTWDKITRTFPVMGTQTGFNIGDMLNTSPSVGLLGLTNASGYNVDTKAWPANCATGTCTPAGSFTMATLQDDDMDTLAGITAAPSTTTGFALPPTKAVFAPVADKVYIVSRNEIALNGMHAVDCTHGTGTAKITLFDNHVVGCHQTNPPGMNFGTPGECMTDAVQFLDDNRTVYGYDSTSGHLASPSHPIMGTVSTVQVAAGATCAMARSVFSPTFN